MSRSSSSSDSESFNLIRRKILGNDIDTRRQLTVSISLEGHVHGSGPGTIMQHTDKGEDYIFELITMNDPNDVIIISDSEDATLEDHKRVRGGVQDHSDADVIIVWDSSKNKEPNQWAMSFNHHGHPSHSASTPKLGKARKSNDTERQLRRVKAENVLLKQRLESQPGTLRELILCDICDDPFQSPYTLPNCGHVFCASCLVKWFRSIRSGCDDSHLPIYTCPMCRRGVTSTPVEAFVLKKIAAIIANPVPLSDEGKRVRKDQDFFFAEFFL